MNEFKASDDFVSKVMNKIYEYEEHRMTGIFQLQGLLNYRPTRITLVAGSVFLALYNIFSIFLAVFIPVMCG